MPFKFIVNKIFKPVDFQHPKAGNENAAERNGWEGHNMKAW